MNKLYRIIVLHAGPKDSHESTEYYLVEKNDMKVAEWIDKNKCHGYWFEESDEPNLRYADDNYKKKIPFKDWVMLNKGDLTDEEGWQDSYYGVTKWGWEDLGEITDLEIDTLRKFSIVLS